jgi:hypothetical protein
MSSLALRSPTLAPRDYLGPGEVTAVGAAQLEVQLEDGESVSARLATVVPYQARVGDEVLVIGGERGHFVIGILSGSGRATLEVQGDLDLRAVGGTVRIAGDEGVRIEGPELDVEVGSLKMIAGAVVQRFASVAQRVADFLHVHAGSSQTFVDGASHSQAKSATILTEDKVTINGKAIHLG